MNTSRKRRSNFPPGPTCGRCPTPSGRRWASQSPIKHLQAVATEAGLGASVDVYGMLERFGAQVPVLAGIRPVGRPSIEAFEAAGGCRAVRKQLQTLLDTTVVNVSGHTLAEVLDTYQVKDAATIWPLADPVATRPAIVVQRGSLCPETGIVKTGIAERKTRRFTGPAR